MGIILYALLAGSLPFDDDDEDVMKEKIIRGEYVLPDSVSREARDLIFNILQPDPKDRLSIEKMLSHPWFTTPPSQHDFEFAFSPSPALRHSVIQEEESPLPTSPSLDDPFVAHGISIQRSSSPSSVASSEGHARSSGYQKGSTGLGILSESELSERSSTVDSDLSLQGSSSRSGASSPVTSEDLPPAAVPQTSESGATSAVSSAESEATTATTTKATKLGHHANASESTIRKIHESPVSLKGKRKQTVPTTPIHEESDDIPSSSTTTTTNGTVTPSFTFPPMPSPARPPIELPGSASADGSVRRRMTSIPNSPAFISSPSVGAGPSRTPSRTKRRSVGSTISERMLPSEESAPSAAAPPFDYVAALHSTHHGPPISTPADEALLVTLGALGFEVGQISHSVRTHACDASGALYWLLKRKAEQKAKSVVKPATGAVKDSAPKDPAALSTKAPAKVPSPTPARADLLQLPPMASSAPATSAVPAIAPSSASSDPKSASSSDWQSAPRSGFSTGTQQTRASAATGTSDYFSALGGPSPAHSEASSRGVSPAPPRSPPTTPPLSQNAALKSLDSTPVASSSGAGTPTGSSVKSPDRKRSQSVSMLQRATSALAPKKNDDANRPAKGKQKELVAEGDEQLGGKKEGKVAIVRGLEEGSKSGSNLPLAALFSRRTVSDSRAPLDRLVMTAADTEFEGRPSVSLPASPVRVAPASGIRRGSDPVGGNMTGSPKSNSDRRPTISSSGTFETLSTLAGDDSTASPKNRPRVNNLFSSFRFWFNEDRRKRKRKVSGGAYGQPLVRGPSASGSIRSRGQGSARKTETKPSPVARQSSTGSRRSSIHSARGVSLDIQQPMRMRRRSDSSRASFSSLTGSRTPTSDHGSIHSTSARRSADHSRRNHVRHPSGGSNGSRRSAAHLSPTTPYRRTQSGTTVRRISSHASGRPHLHSRTHSQTSSIRSALSSDDEDSELRHTTGYDVDETIVEEAEGLEEEADKATRVEKDRAYSERARALRKLSGDEIKHEVTSGSLSDGNRRPAVSTVFTAHKSHNVFGTPTASARSSWGKAGASPIVTPRPALRDVFARSTTDDNEWVDEDDDPLSGYSCGVGQSFIRPDGKMSLPTTLRGQPKTPPVGSAVAVSEAGAGVGSVLGEGRYAGVLSASQGDVATSQWRPAARSKGAAFRTNAIVEEEEEEE